MLAYFCFIKVVVDLGISGIVNLAINKAILIGIKVAVYFFELFL